MPICCVGLSVREERGTREREKGKEGGEKEREAWLGMKWQEVKTDGRIDTQTEMTDGQIDERERGGGGGNQAGR